MLIWDGKAVSLQKLFQLTPWNETISVTINTQVCWGNCLPIIRYLWAQYIFHLNSTNKRKHSSKHFKQHIPTNRMLNDDTLYCRVVRGKENMSIHMFKWRMVNIHWIIPFSKSRLSQWLKGPSWCPDRLCPVVKLALTGYKLAKFNQTVTKDGSSNNGQAGQTCFCSDTTRFWSVKLQQS